MTDAEKGLPKGTRVQLAPHLDAWMQGDRYGEITGHGRPRVVSDVFAGLKFKRCPYYVTLDKSGRRIRLSHSDVQPD